MKITIEKLKTELELKLEAIMNKKGKKFYIRNNELHYLEEGRVIKINLSEVILEHIDTLDIKKMLNDISVEVDFNLNLSGSYERIVPFMISINDKFSFEEIFRVEVVDRLNVVFHDDMTGYNGSIINFGELSEKETLGLKAKNTLDALYQMVEFNLSEISSNVYEFTTEMFSLNTKSIIFAEVVKDKQNEIFPNGNFLYLTDDGKMYLSDISAPPVFNKMSINIANLSFPQDKIIVLRRNGSHYEEI